MLAHSLGEFCNVVVTVLDKVTLISFDRREEVITVVKVGVGPVTVGSVVDSKE